MSLTKKLGLWHTFVKKLTLLRQLFTQNYFWGKFKHAFLLWKKGEKMQEKLSLALLNHMLVYESVAVE